MHRGKSSLSCKPSAQNGVSLEAVTKCFYQVTDRASEKYNFGGMKNDLYLKR